MSGKFKPGDMVTHVNEKFQFIQLFVVKEVEEGVFKCRYRNDNSLMTETFEEFELKQYEQKLSSGLRSLNI